VVARSACGGAAGSVARVSVSRGEASGRGPARADIPRRSDRMLRWLRSDASMVEQRLTIEGRLGLQRRGGCTRVCPSTRSREVWGMWTKNRKRRIDAGRTAAGRPVRSIRKNNVLPDSGPTDLHFGKNDLVLAEFHRRIPKFLVS
jgi:hypothetical protein